MTPLRFVCFRSCGMRIDRDREPAGTFCVTRSSHPPKRSDGLLFPIEGVRRHVWGRVKSNRRWVRRHLTLGQVVVGSPFDTWSVAKSRSTVCVFPSVCRRLMFVFLRGL